MMESFRRVSWVRAWLVWVIIAGCVAGSVAFIPSPVAGQSPTVAAEGRCGVIVEPFPLPADQAAQRPRIVFFPPTGEVFVGVVGVTREVSTRDNTPLVVGWPTVWTIRPWRLQWDQATYVSPAVSDALLDNTNPYNHTAELQYIPSSEQGGYLSFRWGYSWLYETRLQPGPEISNSLTRWIMIGDFIWEPRVLPVVSKTFNGLASQLMVVSNGYPGIVGQPLQFSWIYQWRSALTPHLYSTRHLVYSSINNERGFSLGAHFSAPGLAVSGSGEVFAALNEASLWSEPQIGIWRFDTDAWVWDETVDSGNKWVEVRPAWTRWSQVPAAPGDATGRTTEPVLAFAGEMMLVTYRDSNGLPLLAWTTTNSPDNWQLIRLDDQPTTGRIHIVVDAARQRYVAAWARQGATRTQNQIVIMHGLLADPALHTAPTAITAPGPWFDPTLLVTPNGTVHLVADFVPVEGGGIPQLLTLPARWDAPLTTPQQPLAPVWRQGRILWEEGATMPAGALLNVRSRTGSASVAVTNPAVATLPDTLEPGPALLSLAQPGCGDLPIGGMEVTPPPAVTYRAAEITVAATDPKLITVRLTDGTADRPLYLRLRVRALSDADNQTREMTCTTPFTASGPALEARCSLLDLGGMPAGAATLQIEAVLHDQFGQTAMPLTQATFSATRQVIWTEAWSTATVFISLIQR